MSALKFLGKKSWHTGTIQNQERVWLAEKKKDEEDKKMQILKKQIEEERQIEELRDMAAQASGGTSRVKRVDWMYEVPGASSVSADEYLKGKEFRPSNPTDDVQKMRAENAPGALFVRGQVDPGRDMETKVREDPMLAIKRKEKEQLQAILNNPMKMIMLKKMVDKEKKGKHRDKHDKHSPKRKHSSDRRRSRSPSRSPRKRRSPSPRRSPPRHRSRSPRRHHRSDRNSPRRRSRSRSPQQQRRDRSRSRSPQHHSARRDRSRSPRKSDHSRSGHARPVSTNSEPRHRRPQKQEMTEEERQRRLAEMAQDAASLRQSRIDRAQAGLELEAKEKSEATGDAKFLSTLNRQIYDNDDDTLEARLHRNKHYIQRNADDGNAFKKH